MIEDKNLRKINDRIRRTTQGFSKAQRERYIRQALQDTPANNIKLKYTKQGYLSSKTNIDYSTLVDSIPTAAKLRQMTEAVKDKTWEKLSADELRTAMANIMQHFFYEFYEGDGGGSSLTNSDGGIDFDKVDPKKLARFAEEEGYELDYKKLKEKMSEIGRMYRTTASPIDLIPLIEDANILMRSKAKLK